MYSIILKNLYPTFLGMLGTWSFNFVVCTSGPTQFFHQTLWLIPGNLPIPIKWVNLLKWPILFPRVLRKYTNIRSCISQTFFINTICNINLGLWPLITACQNTLFSSTLKGFCPFYWIGFAFGKREQPQLSNFMPCINFHSLSHISYDAKFFLVSPST